KLPNEIVSTSSSVTGFIPLKEGKTASSYTPQMTFTSCEQKRIAIMTWNDKGHQWGISRVIFRPHTPTFKILDTMKKNHHWDDYSFVDQSNITVNSVNVALIFQSSS